MSISKEDLPVSSPAVDPDSDPEESRIAKKSIEPLPPGSASSTKLLHTMVCLMKYSDEDHCVSADRIISYLRENGLPAERKAVYNYVQILANFGMDLEYVRKQGWHVVSRDFELPELKLLVDAVQCSKFITRKKSDALIRKLEGLCSVWQADRLHREVYVDSRAKVDNEHIYYTVDSIHSAMAANSAICFRYFDLGFSGERIYRHDGAIYTVTPFGLIWNSENYYLVGFDHSAQGLRNYRVDKMAMVQTSKIPPMGRDRYPDFKIAQYAARMFGMFSGDEVQVTLKGTRDKMNIVRDRFGDGVILIPAEPYHFTARVPVFLSPQFFGWLFGLEGKVRIISPPSAVEKYREYLTAALASLDDPSF